MIKHLLVTKSSFGLCQLFWQCDKTASSSIWRWQEHNGYYYLEACVSGWCAHPEENTYMWKSSLHHRNICCQDYVAFEYSSPPVGVWVEEGEGSAVEGNTKDGLLWPESASVVRGDIISATTITSTITVITTTTTATIITATKSIATYTAPFLSRYLRVYSTLRAWSAADSVALRWEVK